MEALTEIIPLIAAAIVPVLVALARKAVTIPGNLIPVLLPIGGGVLAGLGALVGVEVAPDALADVDTLSTAITGILVGAAAVGIHQIKKSRE